MTEIQWSYFYITVGRWLINNVTSCHLLTLLLIKIGLKK